MFKQTKGKAVAAAALSLMMLLSACGAAPGNTNKEDSASASAGGIPEAEETLRTLNTVMGDVEIPVSPQRIAIFGMVGDLAAIGVIPICGNIQAALYDGRLSDDRYTYVEIDDYETVLSLSPDLILLSYQPKQAAYDKLSAIAPTVVIDKFSLSTDERIAFIGDIVGQKEAAAQALRDFDDLAGECRAKLEAAGIVNKTITVMEGEYLFGDKYGRGADVVYNYLGFTAPEKVQQAFDSGEQYLEVSMEVLSGYCGDYIIRSVWDGTEDLSDNAVWNSIPAVSNGHVLELNFDEYASGDLYISAKLMTLLTDSLIALT